MTKKFIISLSLVVAVSAAIIVGGVNWVKSQGFEGKLTIQNWYGNFEEGESNIEVSESEQSLGAIEFESGKITADGLAESVLRRRTVVLTASQVDGLSNDENGVELIPSVGTNKVIQLVSITGFNRFASEAWSRASNESFEVKWDSGALASGGNNRVSIGASFSSGFLTRGAATSTASKSIEVWYPYDSRFFTENELTRSKTASSSAVVLTGNVNPSNAETSGITDFVFEVFYRILPLY